MSIFGRPPRRWSSNHSLKALKGPLPDLIDEFFAWDVVQKGVGCLLVMSRPACLSSQRRGPGGWLLPGWTIGTHCFRWYDLRVPWTMEKAFRDLMRSEGLFRPQTILDTSYTATNWNTQKIQKENCHRTKAPDVTSVWCLFVLSILHLLALNQTTPTAAVKKNACPGHASAGWNGRVYAHHFNESMKECWNQLRPLRDELAHVTGSQRHCHAHAHERGNSQWSSHGFLSHDFSLLVPKKTLRIEAVSEYWDKHANLEEAPTKT